MKQPDTQGNSKHTIWLDNIIGGQDFEHSSRPMYKDAEPVNSLKLTDPHHILLINQ